MEDDYEDFELMESGGLSLSQMIYQSQESENSPFLAPLSQRSNSTAIDEKSSSDNNDKKRKSSTTDSNNIDEFYGLAESPKPKKPKKTRTKKEFGEEEKIKSKQKKKERKRLVSRWRSRKLNLKDEVGHEDSTPQHVLGNLEAMLKQQQEQQNRKDAEHDNSSLSSWDSVSNSNNDNPSSKLEPQDQAMKISSQQNLLSQLTDSVFGDTQTSSKSGNEHDEKQDNGYWNQGYTMPQGAAYYPKKLKQLLRKQQQKQKQKNKRHFRRKYLLHQNTISTNPYSILPWTNHASAVSLKSAKQFHTRNLIHLTSQAILLHRPNLFWLGRPTEENNNDDDNDNEDNDDASLLLQLLFKIPALSSTKGSNKPSTEHMKYKHINIDTIGQTQHNFQVDQINLVLHHAYLKGMCVQTFLQHLWKDRAVAFRKLFQDASNAGATLRTKDQTVACLGMHKDLIQSLSLGRQEEATETSELLQSTTPGPIPSSSTSSSSTSAASSSASSSSHPLALETEENQPRPKDGDGSGSDSELNDAATNVTSQTMGSATIKFSQPSSLMSSSSSSSAPNSSSTQSFVSSKGEGQQSQGNNNASATNTGITSTTLQHDDDQATANIVTPAFCFSKGDILPTIHGPFDELGVIFHRSHQDPFALGILENRGSSFPARTRLTTALFFKQMGLAQVKEDAQQQRTVARDEWKTSSDDDEEEKGLDDDDKNMTTNLHYNLIAFLKERIEQATLSGSPIATSALTAIKRLGYCIPVVPEYHAVMNYCNYMLNSGMPQYTRASDKNNNTESTGKRVRFEKIHDNASSASADDEVSFGFNNICDTLLSQVLDSRRASPNLAYFADFHLLTALVWVVGNLSPKAADVFLSCATTNDNATVTTTTTEAINPIFMMQTLLAYLEEEELFSTGGNMDGMVSIRELDHALVEAAKHIQSKIIDFDGRCHNDKSATEKTRREKKMEHIDYYTWRVALLAGSMLLNSGNKINAPPSASTTGDTTSLYPSSRQNNGIDPIFSPPFTQGDADEMEEVEHEIRHQSPMKFHKSRLALAQSVIDWLECAEQEPKRVSHYCSKATREEQIDDNENEEEKKGDFANYQGRSCYDHNVRANPIIASFLEWHQVMGLLVGKHGEESNNRKNKRRGMPTIWKQISQLHERIVNKTISSLPLCTRRLNQVNARPESQHSGTNNAVLSGLASQLENDPSDINSWRRFVSVLGPLGGRTDNVNSTPTEPGNDQNHQQTCEECKRMKSGFRVRRHCHENRDDPNWWGRDLCDYWDSELLYLYISSPVTYRGRDLKIRQLLEEGAEAFSSLEEEGQEGDIDDDDDAVGKNDIPNDAAIRNDKAWLASILGDEENDQVPTTSQRSKCVARYLPAPIQEFNRKNNQEIDCLIPGYTIESQKEEEHGDSNSNRGAKIVRDRNEVLCYKIVILGHIYGVDNAQLREYFWELARQCCVRDRSGRFTLKKQQYQWRAIQWLAQYHKLNIATIVEDSFKDRYPSFGIASSPRKKKTNKEYMHQSHTLSPPV